MDILFWFLTFGISVINAWGCGRSWTETKASGSFAHVVNWSAAIMSAIGFTWCYALIAGFLGVSIPVEHTVHGQLVTQPYLTTEAYQSFLELNYMVLVIPLLGSGLVILLNSWATLWRERSFGAGAETAWNTYAMGHNIYNAYNINSRSSWGLGDLGSSDDGVPTYLVLIVIAAVLAGGCLTTYLILNSVRKNVAKLRSLQYCYK